MKRPKFIAPWARAKHIKRKSPLDRQLARAMILNRATDGSEHQWAGKPYGRRHLQQAVCRCRRFNLVKPEVLVAAGFNPTEKR